ncbi:hypothetical protein GCM10010399_33770 [Dactylosporangium fulvum]|uniref:Uncharacterized protein n=1 Tax=Dactylosporangium fulvum TaxID=53359 RepID=A0ABY5VZJ8_9ACTN|nr:hypothetical protein [Dactylosporangium fulvum]UWP83212.1 hypothetical protein Dfulv_02580 [Dactylosporangium fulvum]
MKTFALLADKMLARVAPKTTAAACGGCTYSGPYSGPCAGGYGRYRCCYYPVAGACKQSCSFICG